MLSGRKLNCVATEKRRTTTAFAQVIEPPQGRKTEGLAGIGLVRVQPWFVTLFVTSLASEPPHSGRAFGSDCGG